MQLRRNKGSGKAGDSLTEEKKQWSMLSEMKTCDLPHLCLPNLSACPIASELRFLVYSIEPIISALGHVSIELKKKLLQFSSSKHPCGTSNVLGIELVPKSQAWEPKQHHVVMHGHTQRTAPECPPSEIETEVREVFLNER